MPSQPQRNLLDIRSPGLTAAMVEAVSARIRAAGGALALWAVLREDLYESRFGDGFYLHLRGIALVGDAAQALAALAGQSEQIRWHVKPYELGLENGLPALIRPWPEEEEFGIADVVAILAEIPAGGTASQLHTGAGRRAEGPLIGLP